MSRTDTAAETCAGQLTIHMAPHRVDRRFLDVVRSAPAVVAPKWEAAAQRLIALLNNWDDDVAADLFEDNVALDESLDRRRTEAVALIAKHGPLRITTKRPTSAANGDFNARELQSMVRPQQVWHGRNRRVRDDHGALRDDARDRAWADGRSG